MKLSEYLLDRIFSLICMLVAALVLLALLWLIETPAVFILFAEVILLAAYSTALLYDFFRKQSFYNLLQKMTEQMDIKTLLGELMVPPHFLEGQILVDVLRCCNKYQNDQLACAEQENREYREYLDSWVHEIKTPITSARLIVENEKNPTTLRIDDELRKIDAYVEQVLYYARSTDVEKDFKVEKTTLQALVYAALKTYSKPLIQVGGKPVLKELDIPVAADSKSCTFVIGQILSNAIKYRKDNLQVEFSARAEKNTVSLFISDNGIVRQIGSKIRTNYLVVTVVCGLLTITICAVSIGASTALAMNKMSQSATPYDLNVLSNVSVDGDSDIAAYLAAHDITISNYAKATEQISVYEADMTYSELFEGQKVKFWPIDEKVPDSKVSVISISDLNRALAMQNKAPITLNDGQYLLTCNYNGTYRYVAAALQSHPEITVGGATLQRAEDNVLQETYVMTSVGNNDRGTLIVPDFVTASLEKDVNVLLVQYKPDADSNEVLQKMIPIGLDSTHGYRYAEKNMMYETFYGLDALVSFLCCYIGLVFLLICAALLALKQLTETTDNVYRYGLLQKLGAGRRQINHTLFVQTAVFFAIPLVVAGVYSAFLIGKAMAVVEEFMNIHIATNIGLTIVLFLLVYGSYFLATYLSCKRIVTEQRELEV